MDTIRPAARGLPLPFLLTLAGLGWGAGELAAQTVTGRVLDETGERGLELVSIEALGPEDEPLGSIRTDASGRFTLRLTAPAPSFRIEARAFTYQAHVVDDLAVAVGETLVLQTFALRPVPISLSPITATTDPPLVSRGAEWVLRNQQAGRGTFFAGAVLGMVEPPSLTAYLAEHAGLRVLYNFSGIPYLRSTGNLDTCVRVLLNRWPLGSTMFRTIDAIPIDRIAAIEVYNTYRDVPDEMAWDADRCGLVSIWTWDSY